MQNGMTAGQNKNAADCGVRRRIFDTKKRKNQLPFFKVGCGGGI